MSYFVNAVNRTLKHFKLATFAGLQLLGPSAKADLAENLAGGGASTGTVPAGRMEAPTTNDPAWDRLLGWRNQPPRSCFIPGTAIRAGGDGLGWRSAGTNVVVTIHGLLQEDGRTFLPAPHEPAGADVWLVRRARPIFSATLWQRVELGFTPDFGGGSRQILDAGFNLRFTPWLQLQAGKFKPPIGLEQLQNEANTWFNERSLVSDLLPYRDIGLELHGGLGDGWLEYAAGIFNGAPDYNSHTSDSYLAGPGAVAGRWFARPWIASASPLPRGLGLGVGGSSQPEPAGLSQWTPGYKTDGQETFFSYGKSTRPAGGHWRVSPQADYYLGPFGCQGECAVSSQQVTGGARTGAADVTLRHTAWSVSAGWVLTGEAASYDGILPREPFDPCRWRWGAVQLVARYEEFEADDRAFTDGFASSSAGAGFSASAASARAWAVGLNWYLRRDLRLNTSFSRTGFTGGAGAGATVTARSEAVWFTRVQLVF